MQSAVNVQPLIEQVVEHDIRALLIIGRACTTCLGQAWAARVAPVEQPLALERHEHTADLLLPLTEHTGKARDRAGFLLFIEKAEQDPKLQNIQRFRHIQPVSFSGALHEGSMTRSEVRLA